MSDRIGVLIVTYNSEDVIDACLESCAGLRVLVIDNASADTTAARVRAHHVELITNPTNLGFAGAVNQGVAHLDAEYILLLNPDVRLLTPLEPLLEPNTAAAAGCLVNAQGHPQRGFSVRRLPTPMALCFEVLALNRLFPANPVNRNYRCLDLDLSQPALVEQPAAAFFLFRRNVYSSIGGFDEAFHPVWFEDVDFCRRLANSGHEISYVPRVTAAHLGGHSIRTLGWAPREVYWYVSLLRYAFKHFRSMPFRGVAISVVTCCVLRGVVGIVERRSAEPLRVYARIARLAFLSAITGRMP